MKKIFKTIIVGILMTTSFSLVACNDSGENSGTNSDVTSEHDSTKYTDGLKFKYQESENSYHVISYEGSSKEVVIPVTYKNLPVTAIAARAFEGNITIESVTIPSSVAIISLGAFSECYNLKTVKGGNGVALIGGNAFSNAIKLESITLTDNLENIGVEAFFGCSKLKKIYLSSNVSTFGTNLLRGCSGLEEMTFPGEVPLITFFGDLLANIPSSLKKVAYSEGSKELVPMSVVENNSITNVIIPNSITKINIGALYKVSSLVELSFPYVGFGDKETELCYLFGGKSNRYDTPETLRRIRITGGAEIGNETFDGCASIESVFISKEITKMGYSVFAYCSELKSVTFESGSKLESMGVYAFGACLVLNSLTLPKSLKSIGESCFTWNHELKSINVEAGNEYFTSKDGVLFDKDMKTLIVCPTGKEGNYYRVPDSVTTIKCDAFTGSHLSSVIVPVTVTNIERDVFYAWAVNQSIYFEGRSSAPATWSKDWNYACHATIIWNA